MFAWGCFKVKMKNEITTFKKFFCWKFSIFCHAQWARIRYFAQSLRNSLNCTHNRFWWYQRLGYCFSTSWRVSLLQFYDKNCLFSPKSAKIFEKSISYQVFATLVLYRVKGKIFPQKWQHLQGKGIRHLVRFHLRFRIDRGLSGGKWLLKGSKWPNTAQKWPKRTKNGHFWPFSGQRLWAVLAHCVLVTTTRILVVFYPKNQDFSGWDL